MTDVQMFEELDVSCEENALTRLGEMLELLDNKFTQISTEGRISRADASALVERYAVQFDTRYPIASFTQFPSATNLTVAQEGILSTAGQYLMDLIKKAGEILVKIFRWVLDLITFRALREKRAKKQAANLSTIKRAEADLHIAGVTLPPEQVVEIERAFGRYQSVYSSLSEEILKGGYIGPLLRDLQETILLVKSTIKYRVEHLEHLLTILPKTEQEDLAFEENAKSALRSAIGEEIRKRLVNVGIDVPKTATTPKELFGLLVNDISKLSLHKDIEPLQVEEVESIITTNKNGIVNPILNIPPSTLTDVNAIIKQLMQFRTDPRINTTPRGRQVIQTLINAAINEALGVQAYMNAVSLYANARDTLISVVLEYAMAVYQATYSAGMTSPDPAKRQAVQRITERMRLER